MKQKAIIKDIIERARAARLSIAELCRRAEIDPGTFQNWRNDRCGANLRSIERIYEVLDQVDREDARRLAKRGKQAA